MCTCLASRDTAEPNPNPPFVGRGDATVGNPHRAQICQFEFFELILLLKLDKQFPVEQFEATASQSTVPSPPLKDHRAVYVYVYIYIYIYTLSGSWNSLGVILIFRGPLLGAPHYELMCPDLAFSIEACC